MELELPDVIGKGYGDFWHSKQRYRVVKGGRGSKKSCTTALWIIANMMKYPRANTLVVRQYFYTHRDSTFAQLKWAVKRLHVEHLWKFKESKLEAIYLYSGTKILFRGMDDPLSITSITVDAGYLCWVWIEEAYQISNEEAFNKLEMSVRGIVPEGYFKQFTLTFNPWNKYHWLKRRFFDSEDEDVFTDTTTHHCNEWIDDDDRKAFSKMSENRRRVEEFGEWGISEGAIYSEFIENERDFYAVEWKKKYFLINGEKKHLEYINIGVDWGGNKSGHAFCATAITKDFEYVIILASRWIKATGTNPVQVMNLLETFLNQIIARYGFINDIYADSSEQMMLNLLRDSVRCGVRNSLKRPIVDRIDFTDTIMAQRRLFLTQACEPTVEFFKSAIWDPKVLKKKRLDDGSYDVDSGDAFEYSLERFMYYILPDLKPGR